MTGHTIRLVAADGCDDPTERIAEEVDAETTAVSVSYIAPGSGFRHDLRALADVAHAHGALLIVDAAQATGVVSTDVVRDGVDALVTTAMKWLLGPPGVGLAYLSPMLLVDAALLHVGYMGVDLPDDENWPMTDLPPMAHSGRRLELGVPALPLLAGTRAGIELLLGVGIDTIESKVAELVGYCISGLLERNIVVRTPTRLDRRGGVIAIEYAGAELLAQYLRIAGVDIGGYPYGVARIDPHAFNCLEDIDRLLTTLDEFRQKHGHEERL